MLSHGVPPVRLLCGNVTFDARRTYKPDRYKPEL